MAQHHTLGPDEIVGGAAAMRNAEKVEAGRIKALGLLSRVRGEDGVESDEEEDVEEEEVEEMREASQQSQSLIETLRRQRQAMDVKLRRQQPGGRGGDDDEEEEEEDEEEEEEDEEDEYALDNDEDFDLDDEEEEEEEEEEEDSEEEGEWANEVNGRNVAELRSMSPRASASLASAEESQARARALIGQIGAKQSSSQGSSGSSTFVRGAFSGSSRNERGERESHGRGGSGISRPFCGVTRRNTTIGRNGDGHMHAEGEGGGEESALASPVSGGTPPRRTFNTSVTGNGPRKVRGRYGHP